MLGARKRSAGRAAGHFWHKRAQRMVGRGQVLLRIEGRTLLWYRRKHTAVGFHSATGSRCQRTGSATSGGRTLSATARAVDGRPVGAAGHFRKKRAQRLVGRGQVPLRTEGRTLLWYRAIAF